MARGRSSKHGASDPSILGFPPRCAKFWSGFDRDDDAAAATVTTHHHRRSSHAPRWKVLWLCCGETPCTGCARVSACFGTHRARQKLRRQKWMAAAFETLATKHPEHRDRWISDDKWVPVIRADCFAPPSKEREEELKVGRKNMVRAVGSQRGRRQHTISAEASLQQTKMACSGTAAWSLAMMRRGPNQKGGELPVSMPPKQGETILQSQDTPKISKTKMRWTISQIASKRENEPKMKPTNTFLFQSTCL